MIICCCISTSCSFKLKVKKIQYNEVYGFYNYPYQGSKLPLRNKYNELIDKSNFDSFLVSLNTANKHYDINKIIENDLLITNEDDDLVNLYSGIVHSLELNEYSAAKFYANEMLRIYPESEKYTDVRFLQGQIWEKVSKTDSAKFYYEKFLRFSGSKYSKRFRGYNYIDSIDSCFSRERKYAYNYIREVKNKMNISNLSKPEPKYYFESFSPGFLVNREDFYRKTRFLPVLNFNFPPYKTSFLGIGLLTFLSDNYILYAEVNRTKDYTDGQLAFPIEIFKLSSNKFGMNASPVIYYRVADNVEDYTNRFFINIGGSISTGYRFNHRFYTGASYLYYFYNQKHPKYSVFFKSNDNLLDFSIFYQIVKGMSLKAGIVNDHPVIGLTLVGNLFYYDFKSNSVALIFNVY